MTKDDGKLDSLQKDGIQWHDTDSLCLMMMGSVKIFLSEALYCRVLPIVT
jgi:hypothetical protein